MLRYLVAVAFRRGFLGGSRAWTVVGAAALAARALKRLTGGTPKVLYSEELHPGQVLLVSHDRQARVVRAPSTTD